MVRKPEKGDAGEQRLTGFHSVHSALRRNPREILGLWVDGSRRDSRMQALVLLAEQSGVEVHRQSRQSLDALSDGARHQGVLAIRANQSRQDTGLPQFLDTLGSSPLLLILDRVQDPHNLGACLRTADCAGVDAVIVPRDGAAQVNDTVSRVAAGAAERVPVYRVVNLVRCLGELKSRGIWIVGTSDSAEQSLHECDLSGPLALVLGSEGKGLRRLTLEACDSVIRIPMSGSVSSLNVSVAAGVVLFEIRRQRDAGSNT